MHKPREIILFWKSFIWINAIVRLEYIVHNILSVPMPHICRDHIGQLLWLQMFQYHQTSNIRCTSIGNEMVHHSDVVEALPVGAASIASSFST